jgi:hypothetical protein
MEKLARRPLDRSATQRVQKIPQLAHESNILSYLASSKNIFGCSHKKNIWIVPAFDCALQLTVPPQETELVDRTKIRRSDWAVLS